MEVVLQDPFDFGDRRVEKFTLRAPRAKDMRDLPIDLKIGNLMDLAAKLSGTEKAIFNEMSARDAMHMVGEVSSFLAPGQ